jgi:hypothetical protein
MSCNGTNKRVMVVLGHDEQMGDILYVGCPDDVVGKGEVVADYATIEDMVFAIRSSAEPAKTAMRRHIFSHGLPTEARNDECVTELFGEIWRAGEGHYVEDAIRSALTSPTPASAEILEKWYELAEAGELCEVSAVTAVVGLMRDAVDNREGAWINSEDYKELRSLVLGYRAFISEDHAPLFNGNHGTRQAGDKILATVNTMYTNTLLEMVTAYEAGNEPRRRHKEQRNLLESVQRLSEEGLCSSKGVNTYLAMSAVAVEALVENTEGEMRMDAVSRAHKALQLTTEHEALLHRIYQNE